MADPIWRPAPKIATSGRGRDDHDHRRKDRSSFLAANMPGGGDLRAVVIAETIGGQNVTKAEALLKLRSYLLESIAQASDEIKIIDDILIEVKKCQR